MASSVIHVYHAAADHLAIAVTDQAPAMSVVPLRTAAELADALPAIDVLFAPDPPRAGWSGAQQLRLIQLLGVGAERLLPSPDLPARVEVATVRGEFSIEVAEHALALMLSHVRRLPTLAEAATRHHWASIPLGTLAGERLTIVGHGSIGRHLARITRALGMNVTVVSRTGRSAAPRDENDGGVEVLPVTELARAVEDAGYVVVACPLTPATHHLFDATLLARLRPDAYLINVGRGGIVDEVALASRLVDGLLGGAALDVLETEPAPPDSPLWTVPGLTLTPHVAGLGPAYIERCVGALLRNVAALRAGAPRHGLVNRDVGY